MEKFNYSQLFQFTKRSVEVSTTSLNYIKLSSQSFNCKICFSYLQHFATLRFKMLRMFWKYSRFVVKDIYNVNGYLDLG